MFIGEKGTTGKATVSFERNLRCCPSATLAASRIGAFIIPFMALYVQSPLLSLHMEGLNLAGLLLPAACTGKRYSCSGP